MLPYWSVLLSDRTNIFSPEDEVSPYSSYNKVLHVHLQLFGHLPPEFKKRTAEVTFPQAHVLADVASAVTDSTEKRTFQEQGRFKNTMKTPRHLMGTWLSLILPPLEQRTAEVCPCGARR